MAGPGGRAAEGESRPVCRSCAVPVGPPLPPCRPAPADCSGRERAAGAPGPAALRSSSRVRSDDKAGPRGALRRRLRSAASRPTRPPAPPLPPVSGGCFPRGCPRSGDPSAVPAQPPPAAAFPIQELPPPLPVEPVDLRGFSGKEARSACEVVSYSHWREDLCAALGKGYIERLNVVYVMTMVLIRAEDA